MRVMTVIYDSGMKQILRKIIRRIGDNGTVTRKAILSLDYSSSILTLKYINKRANSLIIVNEMKKDDQYICVC